MYVYILFYQKINVSLNCKEIFHEKIGMGNLHSPKPSNAHVVKQLWVTFTKFNTFFFFNLLHIVSNNRQSGLDKHPCNQIMSYNFVFCFNTITLLKRWIIFITIELASISSYSPLYNDVSTRKMPLCSYPLYPLWTRNRHLNNNR